jgi:hypothetical protein
MNSTLAYLQAMPQMQTAITELTSALTRLLHRLESNDRAGLTLSMDQVAAFAELMLDEFDPPASPWTTAWSRLLHHCAALHGLSPGVLNDESEALLLTQTNLQAAFDSLGPLSQAYADLHEQ